MMELSGKNVVYIGGFSGIGYKACSILMQKKIANLVICSRMENVEMLKKLQMEYPTVKVMFVKMNILDRVSIEQAVHQLVGTIKYIDVLINGVGVLADKSVETVIGVNLTGLINVTLACLPYMEQTKMGRGGVVLNIASVFGLEPIGGLEVYAAAKHGVVGFTRSMGSDQYYQKTGVAFICVCPGLTSTEQMMTLRETITWPKYAENTILSLVNGKQQKPEECAVNMVKALELMKNGAVYICSLGQLQEVTPTQYWQL